MNDLVESAGVSSFAIGYERNAQTVCRSHGVQEGVRLEPERLRKISSVKIIITILFYVHVFLNSFVIVFNYYDYCNV